MNTVELPWAPENLIDLGERFISWMIQNRNDLHTKRAVEILWQRQFKIFPIGTLEGFLSLLSNVDTLRTLELDAIDMSPTRPRRYIMQHATSRGYERVVRLVLHIRIDINARSEVYGNALHAAISSGNQTIAELLIQNGADVNCEGGKYGSALQAGAARLGMDPSSRHPAQGRF